MGHCNNSKKPCKTTSPRLPAARGNTTDVSCRLQRSYLFGVSGGEGWQTGSHPLCYKGSTRPGGQLVGLGKTSPRPAICRQVEIPDTFKGVPMMISIDPLEAKASKELWKLYTDGASSKEGSGAGLILKILKGEEITYALRFDFQVSKNEAKYEALLPDLPGGGDAREDALNKLASTSYDHLMKKLLVEVLPEQSIDNQKVNTMSLPPEWTMLFVHCLHQVVLQDDPEEAKKVKIRASHFSIGDNQLYRRGYLSPWLKCIYKVEGQTFLEESHFGDVTAHEGARTLMGKILHLGVYWPDVYTDAATLTKKCKECQPFAPFQNQPGMPLTSIISPWIFHQWGIDIVGPFSPAPGGVKFLLVAVDYFTKWIEVEQLANVTGKKMIKFMTNNILAHFGTPRILISDNDT
uniref:Integrase catalytic domain-containing protein n=1 Tax=Lactuca sativa TaxID=4236 RepID=A0A9R1V8M2_LACSA|nr:hypothetical protein LSAT_V11C600300410 [Lactuca sativa]